MCPSLQVYAGGLPYEKQETLLQSWHQERPPAFLEISILFTLVSYARNTYLLNGEYPLWLESAELSPILSYQPSGILKSSSIPNFFSSQNDRKELRFVDIIYQGYARVSEKDNLSHS